MIGVYCSDEERETAREFFELFKTPWEYIRPGYVYDVILSTKPDTPVPNTNLIIIYSSSSTQFDLLAGLKIETVVCKSLRFADTRIPVYGRLACLHGNGTPLIQTDPNMDIAVLEIITPKAKIIRVGFDLFYEAKNLIQVGQPPENAALPTLDSHIALLRGWILSAGIPLVEIPPIPFGYKFFACLTHDVDFAGIRRHKFDHTMWGFLYRGLVGSLIKFFKGRIIFAKLIKNCIAVMKLPFIFIGLADDFWEHFDKYAEIESGSISTFFLIPFKNKPGENLTRNDLYKRSVAYDINDVGKQIENLMRKGCEIGLHGIDAWHCPEKGSQEFKRIAEISDTQKVGVRIHWLCYDNQSPLMFEQAGFDYDASLGFNETIGFKNGTTQVFQPIGVNRLLEIPLNIQDTALFYPHRLNLSDESARQLCQITLDAVSHFGGVLTASWHDRSLEPERLWGDFYLWLLQELRNRGAWLGSARQVVNWFRQRRLVNFEGFSFEDEKFILKISGENLFLEPKMLLRFFLPSNSQSSEGSGNKYKPIDIPWTGEKIIEMPAKNEEFK